MPPAPPAASKPPPYQQAQPWRKALTSRSPAASIPPRIDDSIPNAFSAAPKRHQHPKPRFEKRVPLRCDERWAVLWYCRNRAKQNASPAPLRARCCGLEPSAAQTGSRVELRHMSIQAFDQNPRALNRFPTLEDVLLRLFAFSSGPLSLFDGFG